MSTKKLGRGLLALGLLGLVLSLSIDLFGGDGRIGASQLLGLQLGVLLAVLGASLVWVLPEQVLRPNLRAGLERIYALPPAAWVMLGFVLVYILFYVFPVFLNADQRMVYFSRYIPDKYPIGLDLSITMGSVRPWVLTSESPYPRLFYPPLTYVLFAPLTLLTERASYSLITALTVLSYCLLGVLAIYQLRDRRDYSLLALVFVSGLLSYGFQFELERGQFNVITFLLCMLALHIFWHWPAFRYVAYLLFSLAIHIKLYPAIFILLFITDWRDWKTNLKRLLGLGLFNFALLFALGFQNFVGFVDAVLVQLRTPSWGWNGNHSVQTFVYNFLKDGYNLLAPEILAFLQANASRLSLILLLSILACILAIVVRAYLRKENGFNPYLFLACTLGALIIPTSNDYTLPILVAPLGIFLCTLPPINQFKNRPLASLLLLTISVAYSSILYPFKYKPYFLNNSFPPLFLILLAVAFLYYLKDNSAETNQTAET